MSGTNADPRAAAAAARAGRAIVDDHHGGGRTHGHHAGRDRRRHLSPVLPARRWTSLALGSLREACEARQDGVGLTDDAIDQLCAARQIVDQARDLAAAITPESTLPSTIDARSSIGALAAITTWLQLSSWLRFIEIASRRSASHGVPSMPLEPERVDDRARQARDRVGLDEAIDERRTQHAVRMAVDLRRHDRVGDGLREIDALDRVGHGESLVSRKRVPIAMPTAPYASAATSPRPSKKPARAITGMSTASTTCGSSTVVGTLPV
jgi:hypothetical protein